MLALIAVGLLNPFGASSMTMGDVYYQAVDTDTDTGKLLFIGSLDRKPEVGIPYFKATEMLDIGWPTESNRTFHVDVQHFDTAHRLIASSIYGWEGEHMEVRLRLSDEEMVVVGSSGSVQWCRCSFDDGALDSNMESRTIVCRAKHHQSGAVEYYECLRSGAWQRSDFPVERLAEYERVASSPLMADHRLGWFHKFVSGRR